MPKYIKFILLNVLIMIFFSCERKYEYEIDFNDKAVKYNDDFIKAVGLQRLFNYETQNIDDLNKYFDTLSYQRESFIVLFVSKNDYEILLKPHNPDYMYIFTKHQVYHINKIRYIIKNWPDDVTPRRTM